MREDSLQQLAKTSPLSPLKFEAKSLFRNILATSPYSSRFCRHRLISTLRKWMETRILRRRRQKNVNVYIQLRPFPLSTVTSHFSSQLRALVDEAENPLGGELK